MTHVKLTSENLKHDWAITSLQPAEAVTVFRHFLLLFCRSMWALFCASIIVMDSLIWPVKSIWCCKVHLSHKMMNFSNKILVEKSVEIITGKEILIKHV